MRGRALGNLYVCDISCVTVNQKKVAFNHRNCTGLEDRQCSRLVNHVISDNKSLTHMTHAFNSKSNVSSVYVWHKRLAHAPFLTLQHIKTIVIHSSLTNDDKMSLQTCEVCHKAKQARLPFPPWITNTQTTFKIVHVDVWGPYT